MSLSRSLAVAIHLKRVGVYSIRLRAIWSKLPCGGGNSRIKRHYPANHLRRKLVYSQSTSIHLLHHTPLIHIMIISGAFATLIIITHAMVIAQPIEINVQRGLSTAVGENRLFARGDSSRSGGGSGPSRAGSTSLHGGGGLSSAGGGPSHGGGGASSRGDGGEQSKSGGGPQSANRGPKRPW